LGHQQQKNNRQSPHRRKIKVKGKEPVGGAHKKVKVHKEPLVYTLTNDDMDHIGYQVWDSVEEIMEEATKK
jgi:hypothetical protein